MNIANRDVLPIDALIPEICSEVFKTGCVILQAAPGAGKTTRVPPALLSVVQKNILVLEPRRLAARLSAERVAFEQGEKVAQTVGYQIRFENATSARTRIKFITEGLFLRYFLSDPQLSEIDCVVLDEFHERHIHTDVALALVRYLQKSTRPDLKLVVMSATLNTNLLANYLPEAKLIVSEGRTYPVEIEHNSKPDTRPLEVCMADAIEHICRDSRCPGHVLAFLPGAAEIRRTAAQISAFAQKHNFELLELRADLTIAEQHKVFSESSRRKIILSTNVAETSLTINGITGVVDSGLAKIAGHAAWSGMPTLDVKAISQASCIQRAGRAGRTAPGVARRIFTLYEFQGRTAFEKPEIVRLDLTQILLELKIASKRLGKNLGIEDLPWFEPPAKANVDACTQLLTVLGALDSAGNSTPVGEKMADYPLHPRLSRVILEGLKNQKAGVGLIAAGLVNEGMIFKKNIDAPDYAHCDVSYQARLFQAFAKRETLTPRQQGWLETTTVRRVEGLLHALCRVSRTKYDECLKPFDENDMSEILLAGFPDRVAQVRSKLRNTGNSNPDRIELNMCSGGSALLSRQSVVKDTEFLIAIDAEETRTSGSAAFATQIRVASGLNTASLLTGSDVYLKEKVDFDWDNDAERVRGAERIYYGALVIDESPVRQWRKEFEETLLKALRDKWPLPFENATSLDFYSMRCSILKDNGFDFSLPDFNSTDFEFLLMHICEGKKSFAEIDEKELGDYMEELISPEARRALNELAPEKITIGASRKVTVHYEEGKPPWIESRLQDFFGTLSTPKVGRGRVPVIVHLLAPNGTAVQVTKDLEGFWERVYPDVRKELSRKYPRHSWPEDPKTALPPEPRPPRGRRK